jgi:hypothetical protein
LERIGLDSEEVVGLLIESFSAGVQYGEVVRVACSTHLPAQLAA